MAKASLAVLFAAMSVRCDVRTVKCERVKALLNLNFDPSFLLSLSSLRVRLTRQADENESSKRVGEKPVAVANWLLAFATRTF